MGNKKTVTGKPRTGEQTNQNNILSDVVSFTGSTVVDLKRVVKSKGGSPQRKNAIPFVVAALNYEDDGSTAGTAGARLSSKDNGDGTFTIYSEKTNFGGSSWVAATAACTVRWTVLVSR